MAARRRVAGRRSWPANLYKNTQGYYWYRDPATNKTFGLGRVYAEAAEQAHTANAAAVMKNGNASLISRMRSGEKTLAEWCDEYIKPLRIKHAGKSSLKDIENETATIRNSEFGKKAITAIEPRDIVAIIKAGELRGSSVSRKLRIRAMQLFRQAINEGLIPPGQNPVESTYAPKRAVTRSRLSLEAFNMVLEKARENPGYAWAVNAFELALVTAQRREDIAELKFADARDGFIWMEQIKTKAKLKIPLGLTLDAAGLSLDTIIRRCRDNVASKSMVHISEARGGAKVGTSLSLGHISMTFAKFRDEAEIPLEEGKTPPSFHEIRSLSARLYTKQYGKDFAQALLGHKSSKMTDLYRDSRGSEWAEVRVLMA